MSNQQRRVSTALLAFLAGFSIAGANAQDHLIEEIIVTAQKREQNMQDVPIAITAYSGDMLQESGIKDIRELAAIAPSLRSSQSQNATTSSFGIRGIGTSGQNFGLESSVGLYIDGVYRSRQSTIINNLVDVQAVEILRGPQGTLFGKNTPSGAINMLTVRPGHDGPNAFVDINVGDLGLVNVSGATDFSLSQDKLAMRLTGFYGQRDGYVGILGQGQDILNDRDRWGGRAQLYYTPNDRFDMRIIADYAEIDEMCCAAVTRVNNFVDYQGSPRSDSVLAGVLGVPVISEDQFEDNIMALSDIPRSTNKDSGLSVEFNYDFANTTLTSISAYRSFDTTDFIDADFGAATIFTDQNLAEQSSFSQELRLTGDIGEAGAWVVGGYYFTQDLNNVSTLTTGAQANTFQTSDPTLSAAIDGINFLASLSPLLPYQPAATAFPDGSFATDDMKQEHESYAVFGQLDFPLGEKFMITAGLRYTQENKSMNGQFLNSQLGPAPDVVDIVTTLTLIQLGLLNPVDPANVPSIFTTLAPTYVPGWGLYLEPSLAPQADVNEKIDDSRTTGTVKMTWFATDDAMFYASYGTGYKSGGTNTDRINPVFSQTFDAETSTAIEIGAKSTLADGRIRLNVALHDTKFEDLQTNAFAGDGFNLQNAGNAETRGVEIDFSWLPTENLNIQAAYAYNEANFTDFENGSPWIATPIQTGIADPGCDPGNPELCDRSGGRVDGNPEQSWYLGAQQDFRVGNATTAFIRAEYSYLSDTMTDGNNDPLKLRESFGLFHMRFGLRFESIDSELAVWGRNLTDERFYETVFDVPVQDGKLNAYPHEPRTWGVTFRKNFQ